MLDRLISLFLQLRTAAMRARPNERGQTGMEIALVGVVCASCVLGAVVIATGEDASQQLEGVFRSGLSRASGTLIVNGSVVVTAEGAPLAADEIILSLGVIGKPEPLDLNFSATADRLVVAFQGETTYDSDVPYKAVEIVGNHDGLLETGETAELRIPVSGIGDGEVLLAASDAWTLQLTAPFGGILEVSRTMPFALNRVNALH